jgi:hypothetical protein
MTMLPDTAAEILRTLAIHKCAFGSVEYRACIEGIVALRLRAAMRRETDSAYLNEQVEHMERELIEKAKQEAANAS